MLNEFLKGGFVGLLTAILGLFVGVELYKALASIFYFPIKLYSDAIEVPYTSFDAIQKAIGTVISIVCWGLVSVVSAILFSNKK